ncbi:Uncharacterised protein [uncultured archaeon]|nr:Uncharacterised protein [uncultured archaeon]
MEVIEKMIREAIAAQKADVGVVKEKRGTAFRLSDVKPYVDVANEMEPAGDQSKAVFDLHKDSINAHYDILSDLTDTVRPEDDPFVEHYQTGPILEILYDEKPDFRKAMEKFIDGIEKAEALISKEVIRRYGGFYGPTCVVDFALVPGGTTNLVNRILKELDIDDDYKRTILASKSWGMNTSYGIGDVFAHALEDGKTAKEAVDEEIKMLKFIYDQPIEAQTKLMEDLGHTSFDVRSYQEQYKKRMKPTIMAAIDDGVLDANIVTVPAYCVGDIAHHISQSTFNMCKDDVIMAVIEAETDVLESTMNRAIKRGIDNEYRVLSLATAATAAGAEYILEKDGFTAPMIVDLLTKRFHNYVQLYPTRGAAAELHNHDFMDMIWRGWMILEKAQRSRNGKKEPLKPKSGDHTIDLSPIDNNEVIMNPQRYAYPGCAISVRFSSLMRLADYPCLLTSEPVTATLMTNIIALHKDNPGAPARVCKHCAITSIDVRHQYCQWAEAV